MNYAEALLEKAIFEWKHEAATNDLKALSEGQDGAMGLTPDHIKSTRAWQHAYAVERAAFKAMRDHNGYMTKTFKKEMAADRMARRGR